MSLISAVFPEQFVVVKKTAELDFLNSRAATVRAAVLWQLLNAV